MFQALLHFCVWRVVPFNARPMGEGDKLVSGEIYGATVNGRFLLWSMLTFISIAYRKTAITPMISHWSYHSLAMSPRYVIYSNHESLKHYGDVIMGAIASQITSLMVVYSIVYSDADQRKHQSSASLAFVRGIHRGPVNSPHKWPVTRKMFPFDDVIMLKSESDS